MNTKYLRQRAEKLGEDTLKEIDNLEKVEDLINLKHIMITIFKEITVKVSQASTTKAEGITFDELLKK